jgi:hypothetical protein
MGNMVTPITTTPTLISQSTKHLENLENLEKSLNENINSIADHVLIGPKISSSSSSTTVYEELDLSEDGEDSDENSIPYFPDVFSAMDQLDRARMSMRKQLIKSVIPFCPLKDGVQVMNQT